MRQPLFLARASYRKRRLRDGARMLPLFGGVLLCFPLLWPYSAQHIVAHWLFLFLVWPALILATAIVSRRLAEPDGPNLETAQKPQDTLAADQGTGP